MEFGKLVCNICGTEHFDVSEYSECVAACSNKIIEERKEEENRKYLEKVNAGLTRIKQAQAYYEEQLEKFKEEFPEEYALNFEVVASSDLVSCENCNCDDCKDRDRNADKKSTEDHYYNPFRSIELNVKQDGKDKEIRAKVNGREVDSLEKLFDSPETRYLSKVLGIVPWER